MRAKLAVVTNGGPRIKVWEMRSNTGVRIIDICEALCKKPEDVITELWQACKFYGEAKYRAHAWREPIGVLWKRMSQDFVSAAAAPKDIANQMEYMHDDVKKQAYTKWETLSRQAIRDAKTIEDISGHAKEFCSRLEDVMSRRVDELARGVLAKIETLVGDRQECNRAFEKLYKQLGSYKETRTLVIARWAETLYSE